MDKSRLRIRFLFLTITFFIIINGVTFNSRAENDLLVIQEQILPQVDRTWSNISLLYNNYFHNSSEVDLEINRFHELVPEIIDKEVIGKSFLGKDITALRITNELRTQQKAKTLVVSHHHGREQITVEIALRFILYLLNNYNIVTFQLVVNGYKGYEILTGKRETTDKKKSVCDFVEIC